MPLVSVVIPVYNAVEFLPRALGDLSAQTLGDFEVICVDDGSTDTSAAVIAEHVARDPRFRLVSQDNAGATAARNRGIDEARGRYLLFLDADDAFEPELLRSISSRLDDTGADVCLYDATVLDDTDALGEGRYLRPALLPEAPVFGPDQVAETVFQLVTPAVWLRMFRRDFLVDHGIRFTPGQIPDDTCFTADALAAAASIAVSREVLVRYRVGRFGAATSLWDERPLVFEEALDDLRHRLEARGQFDAFRHSYEVLCLDTIMHVVRRLTNEPVRELLLAELDSRLLGKYGLDLLRPGSVPLGTLRNDLKMLQARTRPVAPSAPRPHGLRRVAAALRRRLRGQSTS